MEEILSYKIAWLLNITDKISELNIQVRKHFNVLASLVIQYEDSVADCLKKISEHFQETKNEIPLSSRILNAEDSEGNNIAFATEFIFFVVVKL
jgi:hypothetical protein